MTTATVPVVTVEPEAAAHAERIGMKAAFDHMVEVTPKLYAAARAIRVVLEPDWQYDQMNVTWWVDGPYPPGDEWTLARRAWHDEFRRVAPAPRPAFFHLTAPGT